MPVGDVRSGVCRSEPHSTRIVWLGRGFYWMVKRRSPERGSIFAFWGREELGSVCEMCNKRILDEMRVLIDRKSGLVAEYGVFEKRVGG